ncbi:MAG: hypothetical protein AB1439_03265 [candidate division FCPU426 bacterium]
MMKKILVFDQNQEVADGLAMVLESEFKCKAMRVHEREDALRLIEQFRPELLVAACASAKSEIELDWLRQIRRRWSKQELPIILIGTQICKPFMENIPQDLPEMIDTLLPRPFRPNELLSAVEAKMFPSLASA